MAKLDSSLLLRDTEFKLGTTFYVTEPSVAQEIKAGLDMLGQAEKGTDGKHVPVVPTSELAKRLPYKAASHEFAMVWACLGRHCRCADYGVWEQRQDFWKNYLFFGRNQGTELRIKHFDPWVLHEMQMKAYQIALRYGLLEAGRGSGVEGRPEVAVTLTYPFLAKQENLDRRLMGGLLRYHHRRGDRWQGIDDKFKQEFGLILSLAKQVYQVFAVPTMDLGPGEEEGHSLVVDTHGGTFPVHRYLQNKLGVYSDTGQEVAADGLIGDVENYAVKKQRGDLHHLGDELGWIIGAMAQGCRVRLAYPALDGFVYELGDRFSPNPEQKTRYLADHPLNFIRVQNGAGEGMTAKNHFDLVVERCGPFESWSGEATETGSLVHSYGNNPVFQKFAGRKIETVTTQELGKRLTSLTTSPDATEPFLVKGVLGKFVLEVVGTRMAGASTYAIKEGKAGISREELQEDLEKAEPRGGVARGQGKILVEALLSRSAGSDINVFWYLKTLAEEKTPQWIVSEIIDMHDEYRIFVVNHRVSVGTPCHRRSTPLNLYPLGRFHPGLCFSHRSKNIRLNQKTRDRVAQYIKMARKFAREMKAYGKTHEDYQVARHGNYVLDVAWSQQKQQVVAIEINAGEEKAPGDIGMYAANTPLLVGDYLRRNGTWGLPSQVVRRNFATLVQQLGLGKASLDREVRKEPGTGGARWFYFDQDPEFKARPEYLPLALRDRIFTGRAEPGKQWRENPYLEKAGTDGRGQGPGKH